MENAKIGPAGSSSPEREKAGLAAKSRLRSLFPGLYAAAAKKNGRKAQPLLSPEVDERPRLRPGSVLGGDDGVGDPGLGSRLREAREMDGEHGSFDSRTGIPEGKEKADGDDQGSFDLSTCIPKSKEKADDNDQGSFDSRTSIPKGKGKSEDDDLSNSSKDGGGHHVSFDSIAGVFKGKEKTDDDAQGSFDSSIGKGNADGDHLSNSSKDAGDDSSEPFTSTQYSTYTPPTMEEIDRWTYHTDLQRFGQSLQIAANAVFPNDQNSRYSKASVLMLSWADEDPKLPVSLEIEKLVTIFEYYYHYEVEQWKIPDENSHLKLGTKVMNFVNPDIDSKSHLKIVYYAGHARLLDTRALALTSWRNKKSSRCPMVKWGAIQTFLEESPSDALILLDCCASGTANTSEGSGVTEIISACAWNQTANGVGPYSLSSALVIELQRLKQRTSFSVGELYRNLYLRTQSWLPEMKMDDGRDLERHPAPIHLVLTQDQSTPRSIQLPVLSPNRPLSRREQLGMGTASQFGGKEKVQGFTFEEDYLTTSVERKTTGALEDAFIKGNPPMERYPKLAFAVRLKETFQPSQEIGDLFLDWLVHIPVLAQEVKIEARFDSFSTLLIVSVPFALSAYIPRDPAVTALGPILSGTQPAKANSVNLLSWIDYFRPLRLKNERGRALRLALARYLDLYPEGEDPAHPAWQRKEGKLFSNLESIMKTNVGRIGNLGGFGGPR